MVSCSIRYVIDPYQLAEFKRYAKMWIPLIKLFGGTNVAYYLPSEGANNIALAMFTFPSLAAYEQYRQDSLKDQRCVDAFKYADETRCIVSYERSFMKPMFE